MGTNCSCFPARRTQNLLSDHASPKNIREPSGLHIFVLVHGILGAASDWDIWKERMGLRGHQNWQTHVSRSITEELSLQAQFKHASLVSLANSLVEEICIWMEEVSIQRREEPKIVHFICHSIGGVIVRAALPWLSEKLGRFERVSYGHFLTLNTPHLGVRPANLMFAWKHLVKFVNLHRETTLNDPSPGMFEKLADPSGEYCKSLLQFQFCTAVGATHWDLAVPLSSAIISARNPFTSPHIFNGAFTSFWRIDAASGFKDDSIVARVLTRTSHSEDFERHILNLQNQPPISLPEWNVPRWIISEDREVTFPQHMLHGLCKIPWRRIAYTAHCLRGGIVHTFTIGKGQSSLREKAVEFVDLLVRMIEEDL